LGSSRRLFLSGGASALASAFATNFAHSYGTECGWLNERVKRCTIGLLADFPYQPASQETEQWCWAASIQNLMIYNNVDFVSQGQIVEKIFGALEVRGGTEDQIVEAINGYWEDEQNPDFKCICSARLIGSRWRGDDMRVALLAATKKLQDDEGPFIVCYENDPGPTGHVVVAFEVTMDVIDGEKWTNGIKVYDPWGYDDRGGYRDLSTGEINRIRSVITIKVEVV
jgi:hypothetical protein